MLKSARLLKTFKAKAAKSACYIVNRFLSLAIDMKTPTKMCIGKPWDYSSLQIFGCPTNVM